MSDDKTVLPDGLVARRDAIARIIVEESSRIFQMPDHWAKSTAQRIILEVLGAPAPVQRELPLGIRVERLEKAIRFLACQVHAPFMGGISVLAAKEVESILNDKTVG